MMDQPYSIRESLAAVFGREWLQLTTADQVLIIRDCTVDGGVSDLAEYRRHIGTGNLQAYALTQRARFGKRYGSTYTRFSSGAEVYTNRRGRCEDAPCCGCCS